MKTILILLTFALTQISHAALVTLTAQATSTNWSTNEITIGSYEAAELVSFPYSSAVFGWLNIIKDGRTNFYRPLNVSGSTAAPFDPLLFTGPATIRLISSNFETPSMATFRITPEAYPPDKAIIALPGTNQTSITLECSTNLLQWFPATNGLYGPMPEAKFFRIKLERLP